MKITLSCCLLILLGASCASKKKKEPPATKSVVIDFSKGLSMPKKNSLVKSVAWDKSSIRKIADGLYGRLLKGKEKTFCFYEEDGAICVKSGSLDLSGFGEGRKVAEFQGGLAISPFGLFLKNGEILCFYVESPTEDFKDYFSINVVSSKDSGLSWGKPIKVYQAGNHFKSGCWEPAAIQLFSGEIQLFFSNEYPYGDTSEKEISLVRSKDGIAWSKPEKAVFLKGMRAGAPNPILVNNKLLLSYTLAPEEVSMKKKKPYVLTNSTIGWRPSRAWGPFIKDMESEDEGAGPSMVKLLSGETLMALQVVGEGEKNAKMVVYVGNDEGKYFTHITYPFTKDKQEPCICNSIYVKGPDLVTAVTSTSIDGQQGVWLIDGKLQRD